MPLIEDKKKMLFLQFDSINRKLSEYCLLPTNEMCMQKILPLPSLENNDY